jgi:hypothetical protein
MRIDIIGSKWLIVGDFSLNSVMRWTDLNQQLQSMKHILKWCLQCLDLININFIDWKCSCQKSTVSLPPDGSQWRGELTSNWKFTISFNMCRYTYISVLASWKQELAIWEVNGPSYLEIKSANNPSNFYWFIMSMISN